LIRYKQIIILASWFLLICWTFFIADFQYNMSRTIFGLVEIARNIGMNFRAVIFQVPITFLIKYPTISHLQIYCNSTPWFIWKIFRFFFQFSSFFEILLLCAKMHFSAKLKNQQTFKDALMWKVEDFLCPDFYRF
jgi:hypothetical protein